MKSKKPQYHIPGIGGRNKVKNNKPIPTSLMKDDIYPKIKMWVITDDEIERIRDSNPDGRTNRDIKSL